VQNESCSYDYSIAGLQHQIALYEDETAYKKLFFCVFPSLQNFAYSIVRSRQLAEEVVSDVLMAIWNRRHSLMEIENLKVYLFISVRHAAVRKLQQEKRSQNLLPLNELEVEFISDYLPPDESLQLSEIQTSIQKAVKTLPPQCRLIYKLAKEDKLKYREIAELLQISIKTIDNQLSIALRKIAAAISIPRNQKK